MCGVSQLRRCEPALTCAAPCACCCTAACRELHYYTRGISDDSSSSSSKQDQQQQPIVFIHGVAGLLLYLPLLGRLLSCRAPLLLLDMKHVSLRISPSIPTVDELATALAATLQRHKLLPAVLVAHSYGTLVAGRLLRLQRNAVARVLFVDPVCFGMFMPRLLHGFIYAPLRLHLDR
jgi:pimeloyl-ACP methyl ester carboxylesterase